LDCASKGCSSQLTDFSPLTLKDKNRDPFPGKAEDRAHLVHLYDAALRHVDRALGSLLHELERSGIAERTLVVVTSDHGEEQFERGFLQHGKSLHREVLAIPLVVRVPGLAPARVAAPAQQVDVAPTILAALGLPPDPRMQGRDLLAKSVALLPIWSEVNDVRARQASLRDGAWKIVYEPQDAQVRFKSEREWSLFDLARDPEEGEDLSASAGEELARLRRLLESFQQHLSLLSAGLGPPPSGEVDEAAQQMLRGLGYGGGSGPEGASR
ncbi:MAG: sulfatase-like hydrolase/transferase, partial [Planctomycetes bacterium]|nr:sulfatase-like hydrolase/transferase [Planctomycetota bacterium]